MVFWRVLSLSKKSPAEPAHSQWRQYYVTLLVNTMTFVAGLTYGWPAPILPALQSEDSPIGIPPISDEDASWLASIFCLSRVITLPFYMYTIDRLGCRITAFLVAVPFIVSYIMLLLANSVSVLLWARFIIGISAGGTAVLAPSYTIDIAEDSNKGKLNLIYTQTMNFGIAFSYAMGYYTSYMVFHVCCMVIIVFFTVTLFWLPDSPLFLIISGKTEQAREVMKWLRNDAESEYEFQRMKFRAENVIENRKQKMSLSMLKDKKMLRGLFICLVLTTNQQFSGFNVVLAYAVTIFQQAGSAIPPNITTIILGLLMILGTHFSSMAVERLGRRILLISSDGIITLCLFSVGTYFYFQNTGWNVEAVSWIPIVSLLLYILSMGLGLAPVPYTIATELVHPNFRSFVQTVNVMLMSIGTFATSISFTPLVNFVGQQGCFWLYGVCCAAGTMFAFFFVPETKNRSLEDVLEQMGSDRFIHSVLHYKNEARDKETKVIPGKILLRHSQKKCDM